LTGRGKSISYQVAPWFCKPHRFVSFLGGKGLSTDDFELVVV